MATYRIGTFSVKSVTTVGNPVRDFEKSMGILKALAGVMEKRELLTQYPELGMEVNGVPITATEEGVGRNA